MALEGERLPSFPREREGRLAAGPGWASVRQGMFTDTKGDGPSFENMEIPGNLALPYCHVHVKQ